MLLPRSLDNLPCQCIASALLYDRQQGGIAAYANAKGKLGLTMSCLESRLMAGVSFLWFHRGACVPDAVELLHTEHRAQVIGDLLQALLVLLVNDQEGHRLHLPQTPEILKYRRHFGLCITSI